MKERWKVIPGLQGRYKVSDLGRIMSVERFVASARSQSGERLVRERILAQTFASSKERPYLYVGFWIGKKKVFRSVARLVAKAFVPNPDNLPQVNHKDGVRTNNLASNLEWTTGQGNMDHAAETGLLDVNKKLSEEDVREIRRLGQEGLSSYKIAAQFGTIHSNVRAISRQTWKYLPIEN